MEPDTAATHCHVQSQPDDDTTRQFPTEELPHRDQKPPPFSDIVQEQEDAEPDSTIHGFLNATTNDTVIERHLDSVSDSKKQFCEGSDSGVEVVEAVEYHRALSVNSGASQDFDNALVPSCDSSIISCCSNYEEAYNLLVRKNSTLLEDYTLRNGDITSENGSESSSLSGSHGRCRRNNLSCAKKKLCSSGDTKKGLTTTSKDRSRSKPPVTPLRPSSNTASRLKSADRLQNKTSVTSRTCTASHRSKPAPNTLDLTKKDPTKKPSSSRSVPPTCLSRNSTQATPTDDTRWSGKPPLTSMTRSLRTATDQKSKLSHTESKTIEKYATLPRRKKEKDKTVEERKSLTSSTNTKKNSKENTPAKMFSSLYIPKTKIKTKIYHEINIQTALTMSDIEKAFEGATISPKDPQDTEQCSKEVQVDIESKEMEKLKGQLKALTEKYETLIGQHKNQTEKLKETETRLKAETVEKDGLREELNNNSQRVLAILGQAGNSEVTESGASNDSLLVLETRFQNVSQVIIQQEEEIARLNHFCRSFQIDLEKSLAAQKTLLQQHQDLEAESIELQEFMQAEKTTLADALKEAEAEVKKYQQTLEATEKDLSEQREESKQLSRQYDQKRLENLGLQARIGNLEAKSRELLVHQGSSVSGASVALASLIQRLNGLVEELVVAYNISDQELEDVIYHNEAYNNSSSSVESTPEKLKMFADDKQSPNGKGSSFVSAVLNAIKNAATGRDVNRKDSLYDRSSSNEMLDSETEPCLMMEHVLEDVVVPDGHSHNMISSGHGSMLSSRLTHSESLKDVSNVYFSRQCSEPTSLNTSFTSDIFSISEFLPPISLVDQVIDVDNVITRLLKVIRIIQIENDECMNELQDQRDSLTEQVDKQKETNKLVVKQLKDWEVLGARLKAEVKELMGPLSRKNNEIDGIKGELNKQREEVEKLNQDVCDLSTALSKAEMEMKVKEEEVEKQIETWNSSGDMPSAEVVARLVITQSEVSSLNEKIIDKDKRLNELSQEFIASRQVLSESLKDAMNETKRQYDAIDNALEILHSIQSVVQQCPPLSKLQRDLEEVNFLSASSMPLVAPPADCNANAGLGNLPPPAINTSA